MKESSPTTKENLEIARKEIARYVEREKTGEIPTAHFLRPDKEFNVDNLTEEDLEIWEKVQNKNLRKEEFEEYNSKFKQEGSHADRNDIDSSRRMFIEYIRNKAFAIFLEQANKNTP